MAERDDDLQIRSFHVCFELERRLHRIDRFRLPLPYGLPVRGLVYGAAILLAVLVLGTLPVTGDLIGLLHPIIRYAAVPIGGGYLLSELKVDGRSGHAVVGSWLRLQLQPRRLAAFRASRRLRRVVLEPIVVAPDERGPRLRRGVIRGRGHVLLRHPAQLSTRGRTLHVRAQEGQLHARGMHRRGKQIRLQAGQRVVVR